MEQLISVRSLFKETDAYAGKQIKVGGWVRNLRASKNFGFINLSDGTFFSQVQVVYGSELANFTEISKLNIGAAVIVTGTLVLTPDAKQPFELQASEVFVEGPSTPDYPIQPKRHSMEYLRTVTHLRPRTNTFQAVFRVRSLIAYAIHKFFQERDFVYVHTPLITGLGNVVQRGQPLRLVFVGAAELDGLAGDAACLDQLVDAGLCGVEEGLVAQVAVDDVDDVLDVRGFCVLRLGSAGRQTENHDCCEQQCDDLFHVCSSIMFNLYDCGDKIPMIIVQD